MQDNDVINGDVFKIFPHINRLIIYSAVFDERTWSHRQQHINLSLFIKVINESLNNMRSDIEIRIKATHKYGKAYKKKGRSWLYEEFLSTQNEFKQYEQIDITLTQQTQWNEIQEEDCLIIKRL